MRSRTAQFALPRSRRSLGSSAFAIVFLQKTICKKHFAGVSIPKTERGLKGNDKAKRACRSLPRGQLVVDQAHCGCVTMRHVYRQRVSRPQSPTCSIGFSLASPRLAAPPRVALSFIGLRSSAGAVAPCSSSLRLGKRSSLGRCLPLRLN